MKLSIRQVRSLSLACAALLALAAPSSHAQKIYRIVGPDGRVTFSDTPPPPNVQATTMSPSGRAGGGADVGALPLALRQIVGRYPVTLYTGDGCQPCNAGRSLLTARGVPFTERTVTTPQDADALQQLSGQNSLPLLTIGGQQIKGFLSSEWVQYLDAAGYPATSTLPSGYRNPSPTPLVAVSKPAPTQADGGPTAPPAPVTAPPPPPPAATPDNPSGIRF